MIRPQLPALLLLAACGGGGKPDPVTPDPTPEPPGPVATRPDPLDRFDPVPPEVDKTRTAVALPAVPGFELPTPSEGMVSIKELRVAGKKHVGTEVTVSGYVTWIYDCATAIGKPGEPVRAVNKRIEEDPTLCERPKLYLGTTADAVDASVVWVVDVPRAPNKLERARLPRAELAAWPAVPELAVGDKVIVTGRFEQTSPHGEYNSDGLIVYQQSRKATRGDK